MMPGAESQAAEFTHLVVTMLLLIVTTHTLKGLFTNLFPLFKSHILDSNGVWYS